MRTLTIILFFLLLSSCDPDVAGEKVTLPTMDFAFNISPDTVFLKVGDTLDLRTSLNTDYADDNNVLTQGEPLIGAYIGYFGNTIYPITNTDSVAQALDGSHYKLILSKGDVKYNNNKPLILGFIPKIYTDSFIFEAKIIFNKVGLFAIDLNSSFYESSQGKARTNAKFTANNLNWNYYNFPDTENPTPNDEKYYRRFTVAITE